MTCKLEQAGIKPPTLQLVDDMPTTWATATCSVAVKEAYVIRAQGLFFVDIPEKNATKPLFISFSCHPEYILMWKTASDKQTTP